MKIKNLGTKKWTKRHQPFRPLFRMIFHSYLNNKVSNQLKIQEDLAPSHQARSYDWNLIKSFLTVFRIT